MGPLEKLKELARCDHPSPFHIGEHVQWCPQCGALRYRLERPSGELASLEWFRASGVCALAEGQGQAVLSSAATLCLAYLERLRGPVATLERCVERFGTGALLELVFRDLIDVTADGLAVVKKDPPSSTRLRAVGQAGAVR